MRGLAHAYKYTPREIAEMTPQQALMLTDKRDDTLIDMDEAVARGIVPAQEPRKNGVVA